MNRIFLSPPHLSGSELQFVKDAFSSNYIAPLGPQVDAFEEEFSEYTGIKYCVALSSGTAAMHLALKNIGVGPGDEVICSTLTFIGSVSPATFLRADLTFIDCEKKSWNMDPDLLAEALERGAQKGNLPKVVIPTDLYGQCADYERIFDLCRSYGVPVIIDSAEAMGAVYFGKTGEGRHAGKGAQMAVFSFNGNKILTTSGGGILASDDKEMVDRARFLSQQAREPFPHYEHSEIGFNYRMSNILAGIGRGQLRALNERVCRKREIFRYYQKTLSDVPGIEFMPETDCGKCNRWLTVILITAEVFGVDCEYVRIALEKENIESRPVWKPMHLQPVFQSNGAKQTYPSQVYGGKVSEDLFRRGLCLPSGTAMKNSDLDRVIEIIRGCYKQN